MEEALTMAQDQPLTWTPMLCLYTTIPISLGFLKQVDCPDLA